MTGQYGPHDETFRRVENLNLRDEKAPVDGTWGGGKGRGIKPGWTIPRKSISVSLEPLSVSSKSLTSEGVICALRSTVRVQSSGFVDRNVQLPTLEDPRYNEIPAAVAFVDAPLSIIEYLPGKVN